MQKSKQTSIIVAIILLIIVIGGIVAWKSHSNTTTPTGQNTVNSEVEIYGKIINLTKNPQTITLIGDNRKTYNLSIASSTEVIRDVGGTVGGTFSFNNLKVGDRAVFRGIPDANGNVTPVLVEQANSQGIN